MSGGGAEDGIKGAQLVVVTGCVGYEGGADGGSGGGTDGREEETDGMETGTE